MQCVPLHISREQFEIQFASANVPCLFEAADLIPAAESPVDELLRYCGASMVSVGDESAVTLESFVETAKIARSPDSASALLSLTDILDSNELNVYVKDWHYLRSCSSLSFTDPPTCIVDLLDAFLREHRPGQDFHFCYFGAAGSWTGVHSDVMRTHSWSKQIVGVKLWLFWEPGDHKWFKSDYQLKYDPAVMPEPTFRVMQQPGQTIFVPSGWLHSVYNLQDSLSVNCNWANATNFLCMKRYFEEERAKVAAELQDIRDISTDEEFDVLVSKVLKLNIGFSQEDWDDYSMFIEKYP